MDYRIMNEAEFYASKSLWLDCFPEDDAGFVNWYYARRTRPGYALGAFEEGKARPVAMLHMLPMDMRSGDGLRRVGFVAGVCTHPLYRFRGLCTELFSRAFDIMKERGYEATALQPFDTEFYERFGYKTFAYRDKYMLSAARTKGLRHSYDRLFPEPKRLFDMYSAFMEGRTGCSVRSEEYFEGFIEEYSLKGGYIAVDSSACCAGYSEGSSFVATELFYKDGDPLPALALLPRGYSRVYFALPPEEEIRKRLAYVLPGFAPVSANEAFCMAAPLTADFPMGDRPYCLDRY